MAHPAATPLPPPYSPGPSQYFSGDNGTPYFRGQRRRSDRGPLRCFLCDEEGHVAYRCRPNSVAAHAAATGAGTHQRATQGADPGKVTPAQGGPDRVHSGATHFGPTYYRRRPCPWVSRHGSLYNLPGVRHMVALPHPMGSPKTTGIPYTVHTASHCALPGKLSIWISSGVRRGDGLVL